MHPISLHYQISVKIFDTWPSIRPSLTPTSSMATDLSVVLVLVFTFCFAESRKELRTEEMIQKNVIQLGHALPTKTINPSRVTELSWRPRVFLYKGFLSDEECDHLISLGNDNKEKSGGNNSTKTVGRTTNLDISLEIEDEIIARIDERVSAWTFLPKGNGKPFHILHIGSEEIKENQNYMSNTSMLPHESLQATVVMYLSNVTQGGQIVFPQAELGSSRMKSKISSDCTTITQITKPIKGNAILFFNLHPNTSVDQTSLHARCPVAEDDMWWATKIFVVKSIARANSKVSETNDNDLCTDEDDNCPQWAAFGECERNPIYMVGTTDYYGTCRKSCNVC